MSNSLNIKLIAFWATVIFIFAALGIFGYLNQDLIPKKEDAYVPKIEGNNRICSYENKLANVEYTFSLNEDNSVKSVAIKYSSKSGDALEYAKLNEISGLSVSGINSTFEGDVSNFTLMLFIKPDGLDYSTLNNYISKYNDMKIIIINSANYNTYIDAFNENNILVTCQNPAETTTTQIS